MEAVSPFGEVFCIPHGGEYIVYAPLAGLLFVANRRLVNLLCEARVGDAGALAELGLDRRLVDQLFESARTLAPGWSHGTASAFAPTTVTLCLTTDCTLRCLYCYADGGRRKVQMPWPMVTDVIDQIVENASASRAERVAVSFHGGGDLGAAWDLLRRTRRYLADTVEAKGIRVETMAGLNGILNEAQCRWLKENIDHATLSIDGPPRFQDRYRPLPTSAPSSPVVDRTLRTLDALGFRYGIRATITAESVESLEEIVAFLCERYGALSIKVEPMFPRGRAASPGLRAPDAATFVAHFRRAREIAESFGRRLSYSGARLEVLTSTFCQAAGQSCTVTPSGWVTSCYEVLEPEDPLAERFFYGRYDHQRRRLVFDEARRQALLRESAVELPGCAKCFCKWHCAGDCPAKRAWAARSPPDPLPDRCAINRELTKDQLVRALSTRTPRLA